MYYPHACPIVQTAILWSLGGHLRGFRKDQIYLSNMRVRDPMLRPSYLTAMSLPAPWPNQHPTLDGPRRNTEGRSWDPESSQSPVTHPNQVCLFK